MSAVNEPTIRELCERVIAQPKSGLFMTDAENELRCRLSPDVVLAVVEALEAVCEADDRRELEAAIPKCLTALQLLNRPKP